MLPQVLLAGALAASAAKPNVVFILADDLGWNDIGHHGSPQVPTDSIDAICEGGVTLNRFYAQPVCSPTRGSLMSGRHVIHSGIYSPFAQGTALRLNASYTLLPEYMKRHGYDTHMVGKWHLGQNTRDVLPTGRGFDSYLGYYSGAEDYITHEIFNGYDFFEDETPAFEFNGIYSTFTFAQRAVDIIDSYVEGHRPPFFMYVAFQNVHWPLEVPAEYEKPFSAIPDPTRRTIAGMINILNEGVGNITAALHRNGMMDNTMVIFQSDNGGPTNHTEGTQSNNFPLRGGKNTLWEGGTRVCSCIMGPLLQKHAGAVWNGYMHVTDWLPTILDMTGGTVPVTPQEGDGLSIWSGLKDLAASPRTWVLSEAHQGNHTAHGNGLIVGDMKIVLIGPIDPAGERGWYPPPGQDPSNVTYSVECGPAPAWRKDQCTKTFCLFNVTADPCEYHDVAEQHPDIVAQLAKRLQTFRDTAVPPTEPVGCNPTVNKDTGAWTTCG